MDATASGAADSSQSRESDGVAYISYAPGSLPTADSLEVHNLNRGHRVGGRVYEGGLDPIALPASVGDSLHIRIFEGGSLLTNDYAFVPKDNPPRVVRTSPGRRQTRVPINFSIEVIFTEPLAAVSVNSENVLLLNGGQTVPTTLALSENGLRVEINSTQPLQAGTTYTILLTTGVVDVAGEGMEEPFSSEFQTEFTPGTGAILITTVTSNNLDPDGFVLSLDGASVGSVGANGFVTIPDVPIGSHQLSPAGIAPNCVLQGEKTRTISVSEGITAGETFAVTCTDPPEGRILFHHGGTESAWMSVMNADGTGEIDLLQVDGGEDAGRSVWSPSGSKIAFSGLNGQGGLEIYLMNKDASGLVPLRPGGDGDRWERYPTWSPEETMILFERRDGLWWTGADGSGLEQEWPSVDALSLPRMPDLSPSGLEIVFSYGFLTILSVGDHQAHGQAAPGCEGPSSSCWDDLPLWSPIGNQILFRRTQDQGGPEDGLWVYHPYEGSATKLVDDALWFDWSPDGTEIVYTDSEGIFIMNADGSGKKLIRDIRENFDEASETAYSRVSWGR